LNSIPIIRFELEGMKRTIVTALMQHQAQMDQDIQAAYRRVVHQAAREEIDKFFRYGEGRKEIAEVIKQKILDKKTYGPLDDEGGHI
jgi:outer membrane protein assembly factor BamD (BamD/ComL family)